MEVRKLTQEEKFDARLISTFAFHFRMEDPEKEKRESETDLTEDWGAFDDDGRLMAHVMNFKFLFRQDGQWVPAGGIGSVSTLPEYRERGAIRAIFRELLKSSYQEGQVLSGLYPFNHAFYRKFGYETVRWRDQYKFPPEMLREYHFSGRAVLWQPGDPVSEYTALYEKFASDFNLAIRRDDKRMQDDHVKSEWSKERRFSYMLYEANKPVAYLTFQDVRNDPAPELAVKDYALDGSAGFRALLGFLGRFTADYGSISIFLPTCLELASVIHSPSAYDIQQTGWQNYMVRVVNVEKLLGILRKPADCSFTVQVSDPMIPENNGVWAVRNDKVERTETQPDLCVSAQAFGQLAVGSVSLGEAILREDVQVKGNFETLSRIFVRKPILIADHY